MKDPAFLFYTSDYYEGTRTMLPEERACYMDLLVYQHKNGFIPNDLKRVLLYCTGISEETLVTVLNSKFTLCDTLSDTHSERKGCVSGWVNKKLQKVMSERVEFSKKQSMNGAVGNFWKKSKSLLSVEKYNELRKELSVFSISELFDEIQKIDEINDESINAMRVAMRYAKRTHLENEIENKNIISDKEKGGMGEKTERPTFKKQPLLNFQQLKKQCLENQQWVEAICMGLRISPTELPARLDDFINKLISTGNKNERTLQDFQGYFFNSEKYNIGKNPKQDEPQRKQRQIV